MPFESPADGKVHLVAGEGDTVPVGGVIAYLAADEAQYQAVCTASAAPPGGPPVSRRTPGGPGPHGPESRRRQDHRIAFGPQKAEKAGLTSL